MEPDMNDEQVVTLLRQAGDGITPPVEALVRGAVARGELRRRQRRGRVLMASSAGALALAVLAVAVVPRLGATAHRQPAPTPPAATSHAPATAAATQVWRCPQPLNTDPLPTWARAGFSDPAAPGVPHVIGSGGRIAAIMFGPLRAPESKTISNKILWVTKVSADPSPLEVIATLHSSREVIRQEYPSGPGPSYLELPDPGCWDLSLTWNAGTQHDELSLYYGPPS
jgi:hypothetical protein